MTEPRYLSIALRVDRAPAFVIGRGLVVANMIKLLLARDATITALVPDLTPEIDSWTSQGMLSGDVVMASRTTARVVLKGRPAGNIFRRSVLQCKL